MRKFKVTIETGVVNGVFEDIFEVEDDATKEEITDEAKEIFLNQCGYGYTEITDEEE